MLAARAALPIVCERQEEFLLKGDRKRLVDVSLADLARRTGFSVIEIAKGFRRVAVQSRAGVVPVDKLVGPVGPASPGIPIGYIDPTLLIPTDHPRDPAAYTAFVEIFREGRESILDPVLAVEDPRTSPKGFLLQGHHRAAAAFSTHRRVRVAILRTREDLLEHVQEGTAAEYARGCTSFDKFLEICREQSRRLRLYEHGWPEWLAALA